MLWLLRIRFCKFWNRISLCFVLWEIFFQISVFTLLTLRPSMFSGGKIFSITCSDFSVLSIPQIRSWVTFFNFSLKIGGCLFSVLSYFWVRFSRCSVSADESSACETVESFRSGLGGSSSWGEITPWDVTNCVATMGSTFCIFCGLDGSSPLLKTQWLEGFEKPAKHDLNWDQGPRGYYCFFLGTTAIVFFIVLKISSISSGVWTAISIIIKKMSYKSDKSVVNMNNMNVKVHICKYIANNFAGYLCL